MNQHADDAKNLNLIGHHDLGGFGVGEGMSIQLARDGRRILWLAHEGPPKNFSALDVSDPRNPSLVVQTELPHKEVRSNSLEVVGDLMAVAYQTRGPGGLGDPGFGKDPAGVELFDIAKPGQPRSISFFNCAGPGSMGVHQLWFVDGETVHFAGGAEDFVPRNPLDCQFYRAIDVRDPAKPVEAGRWWFPGTREGDAEPPPPRHPRFDMGYRAHNTNVYPERPDRVYLGYLDGGAIILDIADRAHPKMVGHWNPHPPQNGFTHTLLPLFDRELLVISDETVTNNAEDGPKLTWVVDARLEQNLVPLSTLPMPPVEEYRHRGGRFGSHNLHENRPGPAFRSSELIFATFFNGGLRVFNIADPLRPVEVAHFVPAAPAKSPVGAIQINDVFVDENRIVYAADRSGGGIYILELEL